MVNFIGKMKRFFFSKKRIWIFWGSLLAIFFIFFMLWGIKSTANGKVYHIGQDDHWYALNLMGKEKNMTAFSNNLLRLIAIEKGFRFSLVSASPSMLESRLNAGDLDGIISPLEPSPYLQDKYIFSTAYFLTGPVLVVSNTSKFDNWNENGYKIIGIADEAATSLELQQEFHILLQLYNNPLKALSDLNAGLIDGVVLPAVPAYIYVNTFYPTQLKVVTTPLNHDGFRLIALNNRQGQALIEDFNAGLKSLKDQERYQALFEQWGFINPEKTNNLSH